MTYYANDIIRISGSFDNAAGTATDPTGLSLVVKPRHGSATTVAYNPGAIVRDAAGEFHYDWTAPAVTVRTKYDVQWKPTGAVQRASDPERIVVSPLLS